MLERWEAAYGSLLSRQLEAGRRYSVVRVGAVEFAFTCYQRLTEALGQAWDAGLVPEPRPNVLGRDLPDTAPCLRGVDSDLHGLRRSDDVPPFELV